MSACNKICHVMRLRQMLKRWRKKAASTSRHLLPPAGHVVVYAGHNCKRFVVRATHLNHPLFKKLLVQAEEEFGFNNSGPLAIPCDENVFEEIIRYLSRTDSNKLIRFTNVEQFQRYFNMGIWSNIEFWPESRPLLNGL